MDEKAYVGWPRGRPPTREEALAMARRLVEQIESRRLLREALPAEPKPNED